MVSNIFCYSTYDICVSSVETSMVTILQINTKHYSVPMIVVFKVSQGSNAVCLPADNDYDEVGRHRHTITFRFFRSYTK